MLVQKPPTPRYGEIEVDGVKYKFSVKKTFKQKHCQISIYGYVNEEYVTEIMKVPKNLSIGAPIQLAENKVCLLRSEVKPAIYWSKAARYFKRR